MFTVQQIEYCCSQIALKKVSEDSEMLLNGHKVLSLKKWCLAQ